MPFTLDSVVPWGRSFDEYLRMFDLTPLDLSSFILSCADGPASFNSHATKRGYRVISCDPIYRFSPDEIKAQILATYEKILAETRANRGDFVWNYFSSPEELGEVRMRAMQEFLEDYTRGRLEGRYQEASLPNLPHSDKEFDLSLSSHFLFLYSDQFTYEFHLESIKEMSRVSKQVRIFPLLKIGGERSRHVEGIREEMKRLGCEVEIKRVGYEFQRGGNEMMKIVC